MPRDDPAWVAASDQADAAVRDVAARTRDAYRAAVAVGLADWGAEAFETPRGPAAEVLERVRARLAARDVELCPHAVLALAPGLTRTPPPEVLAWVAWHPRAIACPPCALELPAASDEENRRCDACSRVTAPGEEMVVSQHVLRANPDALEPGEAIAPPLMCGFGLCRKCARRSGLKAPGGAAL